MYQNKYSLISHCGIYSVVILLQKIRISNNWTPVRYSRSKTDNLEIINYLLQIGLHFSTRASYLTAYYYDCYCDYYWWSWNNCIILRIHTHTLAHSKLLQVSTMSCKTKAGREHRHAIVSANTYHPWHILYRISY